MRLFIISICLFFLHSCSSSDKQIEISTWVERIPLDEKIYILNDSFPSWDARRYGVTAETARNGHPKTGKNRLESLLDLAEDCGTEITLPSGFYKMNLTLDSRKNVNLRFDNSVFQLIHITQNNKGDPVPENISLKGTLIALDRLGITEAKNVSIDTIFLETNIEMNLNKTRNRGCHIYHGSKDISIGYLQIDDLGSGNKKQENTHAAIAIDGQDNNPKNVKINKAIINSSDRHGVYLTGSNHEICELKIKNFGIGTTSFMSRMQDTENEEEKRLTGVWLNKCTNSVIDHLVIDEQNSRASFTANFEDGDFNKPNIINNFIILNNNPYIAIRKGSKSAILINSLKN